MSVSSAEIVRVVKAEIGVHEDPMGSNTGARVIQYQAATAYSHTQKTGWPWCDAFYTWSCEQAGLVPNCGSASTAETWRIAQARGEDSRVPVVGGAIIWPGVHIGVVVGIGPDLVVRNGVAVSGTVYTVEGNSGDAVTPHTRSVVGAYFIAPKGLTQPADPSLVKLLWLDDPHATYVVKGPWRKEASAEKTKAGLKPALRARATVVHTGDGKFALRIGELPRYGPWLDVDHRKKAKATIERRLGRKLIERSTATKRTVATTAPAAAAEGLGKTV